MSVRYFNLNEAMEVFEISDKLPPKAACHSYCPEIWARQPVGEYRKGCDWVYGPGWLNHSDINAHSPWMQLWHNARRWVG